VHTAGPVDAGEEGAALGRRTLCGPGVLPVLDGPVLRCRRSAGPRPPRRRRQRRPPLCAAAARVGRDGEAACCQEWRDLADGGRDGRAVHSVQLCQGRML
jgi:hypothetical protein